jgi:hypothetical protein
MKHLTNKILLSVLIAASLVISSSSATLLASNMAAAYRPPSEYPLPQQYCYEGGAILNLYVNFNVIGFPVEDATILIDASNAKLIESHPIADGGSADCAIEEYFGLPSFSWQIYSRTGQAEFSTSQLQNADTLTPSLLVDEIGQYRIRFTACPAGCDITYQDFDGNTRVAHVSAQIRDVPAIIVTSNGPLRPHSDPVLPSSAKVSGTVEAVDGRAMCGLDDFGTKPGFTDAKWVTIGSNLNLPSDYKLAEGKVVRSEVSWDDAIISHDYPDLILEIDTDPKYNNISAVAIKDPGHPGRLHAEWERNNIPEQYWPTLDDRVSLYGYWVLDCGHDEFWSELHPFLGIATQRARPILIPSTELWDLDWNTDTAPSNVGTNVYVPGIVTDVWFNRMGGQATNGDLTSLHEPETGHFGQERQFTNPNPMNGAVEFNIYLPPNPKKLMEEAGRPEVPNIHLYVDQTDPQADRCSPDYQEIDTGEGILTLGACTSAAEGLGTVPIPDIQKIVDDDGTTYLKVRLDFTNFKGMTYSTKITAGWVYPSPDNWTLQKWRLKVNYLEVFDDGDLYLSRGCGDWGFWLNTSNRDQEWIKLFDGDGSICDKTSGSVKITSSLVGQAPWQTGSALGPDILTQASIRDICGGICPSMWVRASGSEEDSYFYYEIGEINDKIPLSILPQPIHMDTPRTCHPGSDTGCAGNYRLNYDVLPLGGISPSLSPQAEQLYRSMFVDSSSTNPCCELASGVDEYSIDRKLSPGQSLALSEISLEIEEEDYLFKDVATANKFNVDVTKSYKANPEWTKTMLTKLDAQIEGKMIFSKIGSKEFGADLKLLKIAIPKNLWSLYFGNLDKFSLTKPKLIPMEAGNSIFQIEAQNKTFDISVSGEGIQSLDFSQELQTIYLENDGTAGTLEVVIPKELLGGTFTILIDNEHIQPKISESDTESRILLERPANSTAITIQGTNVIPEFPFTIVTFSATLGLVTVILQYLFRGYRSRDL